MIGRTLGHYRVVEPLGAGGMGEVFRAHDEKLDRDVALKVLPEGALRDEEARKRFQREANALSRLSHPHIATIHDFDTAEGVDFLVMELVRGPSLRDEIEEKGALPEKTVVRLGAQLAHGLQAAHEQGIVHRDLKPGNLQLTPDGLLKILDFGLARLLPKEPEPGEETAPTQTAVRQVAGTLPYMSPEQLRGRGVDARTDLYAAGAVLYEMATGKRLFSKPSSAELTDAILHEEPAPPREVNERISPGLEAVILKALDKDPELRHQTAKDLRVDLERLQLRPDSRPSGSGPSRETEASAAGEPALEGSARPSHGRSWRRWLGVLAASVALTAVAAGVAWWSRPAPVPRITGVHALSTLNPPNPGWNVILYVATDGERLYHVAVKGDRNVLRHVPLSGGESDETPLPFPGAVFVLSAIPGEPALIMAGSHEGLVPAVADEGWPLWRVPVGGGAPQRLGELVAKQADVSPDGRTLALARGDSLILATIDGANPRELLRLAHPAWRLKWAPDGSRLRFASLGPGDSQESWIWEVSVTGGAPTPLWPGAGGDWTRDGQHYVFTRWPSGDLFIARESWWRRWRAAVPQPLTSGALAHVLVGSSRDGRRLVAWLRPPDPAQGGTLMRYDPERKGFEPALGGESAMYAEPSPDGAWLAWVRYPEGTLWRSRPDGSDRLRLTSPPAIAHLPRWSPDGRRIAFSSQPDPSAFGKEIRVVAADGSESDVVARPARAGVAYWDPCWLPDGSIVFSHTRNETLGILRYDPVTRSVEPLPGAQALMHPKCSPRGDVLATEYAQGRSRWMLRRWGTEGWRELGSFTHPYPTWTRDGRSVCGLSLPGYRVECMDVDEGRMRVVADTSSLQLATWVIVPWMGLDAEDRPLVTAAAGSQASTIYALDWEAP